MSIDSVKQNLKNGATCAVIGTIAGFASAWAVSSPIGKKGGAVFGLLSGLAVVSLNLAAEKVFKLSSKEQQKNASIAAKIAAIASIFFGTAAVAAKLLPFVTKQTLPFKSAVALNGAIACGAVLLDCGYEFAFNKSL